VRNLASVFNLTRVPAVSFRNGAIAYIWNLKQKYRCCRREPYVLFTFGAIRPTHPWDPSGSLGPPWNL